MPDLANCPGEQTCQLVAGDFICVEGSVTDAAVSDGSDDDANDAAADAAGDAATAAPWTLVQTRANEVAQLAVPATGAGHLIVVAVQTEEDGAATAVTDNAGNSYVAIMGSRAIVPNRGLAIELWYAKSSIAGATQISATAPTVYTVAVWEVSGIRTMNPLDTAGALGNQAATTMPVGPTITTSTAGEFMVSVAIVQNQVSGIASGSGFTNDHLANGNGWAHLTSPIAPPGAYQARWNSNSGVYCATAAAFVTGP